MPEDGLLLRLWWGISLSASKYGLVWMGLLFVLLIAPGWKQSLVLLLPVLLLIGAAAWLNEHQLKPALAVPRPSIEFLASEQSGAILPQGAENFYALPDKASRSAYLKSRLGAESSLRMPPLLRDHWIEETGFSFPSGHAFAATALSGWFIFVLLCMRKRLWLLPVFWGWAVLVCYSRVVLGVHRPEDILAGSIEAVVVLLLLLALQRFSAMATV